jgi:hypothetical protein
MFDDTENKGDFDGGADCPLCQEPLCEDCGFCHDCETGEEEQVPSLYINLTVEAVLSVLTASRAAKRAARRPKRG